MYKRIEMEPSQVDEYEDLLPSVVGSLALLRLLDYDVRYICDHLQEIARNYSFSCDCHYLSMAPK